MGKVPIGKCDKCGREVMSCDDAVNLDVHAGRMGLGILMVVPPRHLLPIVEDGIQVCEGSPSRAQYLAGQPRDKRGLSYWEELEIPIRSAYALMQAD